MRAWTGHLLDDPKHQGLARLVGDLNHQYRSEPALHAKDCDPAGFRWVEANDAENGVLSYLRHGFETDPPLLVALNFTPVIRRNYRLGVPRGGDWAEVLNSDATIYGGSGQGNLGTLDGRSGRLARAATLGRYHAPAPRDGAVQTRAGCRKFAEGRHVMIHQWRPTVGAWPVRDGVQFRVWAPTANDR